MLYYSRKVQQYGINFLIDNNYHLIYILIKWDLENTRGEYMKKL